jgi:membrane-bound lytic murein transglycosylase MltF
VLSVLDELPEEIDRMLEPWQGDLDAMIERRVIRIVTVFNPMLYFLDGPRQRGAVYEAAAEFEKLLNRKLQRRRLKVNVILIPVTRDDLIRALVEGRGDIAAANLTITPERLEQVDFTQPVLRDVSEVLVTGPTAPGIDTLEELSGQELHLRRSSSYWSSVETLSRRLVDAGRSPVRMVSSSEWVEDNGLLELVNSGVLPMTVVDAHKARFWSQFFRQVEVREDLALRTGGEIAWAFRKNSPQLKQELDGFVRKHRKGTLFGNILFKRYLEENEWVHNALDPADQLRFNDMSDLFRKYGEQYGLDWLLVAAQAYQESRLDQKLSSRAGAVGVMQVLPATARQMGINDLHDLESNVHAGVKYMHHLMETYFADMPLDPRQRELMALAAYNAGPGRIRRLRRLAESAGLDPDVWFQNVEVLAARHVGAEPVRYVSNITKYYLTYKLLAQRVERESGRMVSDLEH